MQRRLWFAMVLLMGGVLACGGDSDPPITPVNRAPTIDLTFTKLGVVRNIPVDLTVAVDDADEDPLTINWSITRGALTAQNASKTVMRWTVPSTVGVDTVEVSVTDGQLTRRVTAPIKVGYAAITSVAVGTLLASRSPYIVAPSALPPTIQVQEGQTVTVEPGVEILIDTQGTTINVIGTLVCNGTPADPVVIRANDRTLQCGDERGWWAGLRGSTFSDGVNTFNGHIDLTSTEVWYAQAGIRLRDGATADVHESIFKCSGDAGLLIEGSGALVVEDTEVSNGRVDGIVVSAVASLPDSVVIRDCNITINENSGIRLDLNDTSNEVPITIVYNRIVSNFSRGISLARAVFPYVHFNHFSGNGITSGVQNVYLEDGYPLTPFPQLNMSCNFWGGVINQESVIKATVRDDQDTGAVNTRVIVSPWLNESPITTPPSCTPPLP